MSEESASNESSCTSNPPSLPDDVRKYLIHRGRLLHHESQRISLIEMERRDLLDLARHYGVPELELTTKESDPDDAVSEVESFCLTGSDVPFFSESVLYELVGKEDARTILAIVNRLIERCGQ